LHVSKTNIKDDIQFAINEKRSYLTPLEVPNMELKTKTKRKETIMELKKFFTAMATMVPTGATVMTKTYKADNNNIGNTRAEIIRPVYRRPALSGIRLMLRYM
jgi:hypothetical protein